MSEQIVRSIEVITAEIRFYQRQTGMSLLEIGKRLNEAKEQMDHGEWLSWLEQKVEVSASMAQKMMKVAREYANTESIPHLGVTKALALLSVPAEEREQFAEAVNAEALSVRELKQAIREREEALQRAERERDRARRELNSRQTELKAQKEFAAKLQQDKREALSRLEELECRPPETVTVDASEAQLAAAEQRGREQVQSELEPSNRALREQVAHMEQELTRTQEELVQKQNELTALQRTPTDSSTEAKTAQTLGEINGRLRAMQEADRRITELMDTLDEVTRRRVQGVRETLLRRMLGDISG